MPRGTVIDMFCGAGGFSCGFRDAGYEILCGIDIDKSSMRSFASNHRRAECLVADIADVAVQERILQKYGAKVDVVIGGPPCQGFSSANQYTRNTDNPLNELPLTYAKLAMALGPSLVVMEEVPQVKKLGSVFSDVIHAFQDGGYTVRHHVIKCEKYGLPQNRHRLFLVAYKECNVTSSFPPVETHDSPVVVQDALKGLNTSKLEIARIPATTLERVKEWETGTSKWNNWYGVIDASKPMSTITAHVISPSSGTFVLKRNDGSYTHLTVRECARLQGFPDDYMFVHEPRQSYKQIGNSVPPMIATKIANSIQIHNKRKVHCDLDVSSMEETALLSILNKVTMRLVDISS